MGKLTTVNLSEHFEAFISEQTAEGRYESPSAVVQAGLRLLEEHEAKLTAIRKAVVDGIASGEAVPSDFEEFYAELESPTATSREEAALHSAGCRRSSKHRPL